MYRASANPAITNSYLAELSGWLERHKHYPAKARNYQMQGTALLYFRITREGQVLDYHLTQSTGHDLLDEAVLDMIRRVQPRSAAAAGDV